MTGFWLLFADWLVASAVVVVGVAVSVAVGGVIACGGAGPGMPPWQADFDDHADAACALAAPVTPDNPTGAEVDAVFGQIVGSDEMRAFNRAADDRAKRGAP